MIVLNKTAWWINTDENWRERWSKKALKHVVSRLGFYQQNVEMEVLDSSEIKNLFWPLYRETIMKKKNYHLTEKFIVESIDKISRDASYKLIWFRSRDGYELGGNVIHIFPDLVKGVYRTYNHKQNQEKGYRDFDYYADYMMQDYVAELGIKRLSRGLMAHPCDNIGLVVFKLRTGAIPYVPVVKSTIEVTPEMIEERVDEQHNYAFFTSPDSEGRFRQITLYLREENEGAIQLRNVCSRLGIKVKYKYL